MVHRDAIDLLWWRRDVSPLYDGTTFDATVTHHCFADVGLVSFRSAWKADATHLLYQGGRMFGDHDHTSLGSFTLYRHGYLVSSEGNDQVSKRTVNGATLLVNGFGQHGDGLAEAPAVPEHGTSTPPDDYNNSKLTVYLDNKGVGPDSKHFDVAIAGTDLLPLHRFDPGVSDDRGESGFTNITGLAKLQRYVIWIDGQAVLVDDLYDAGTNNYRYDWTLPVESYSSSGAADTCPVTPSGAYYEYDGPSTYYMKYGPGTITDDGGGHATLQSLNEGIWTASTSSCSAHPASAIVPPGTRTASFATITPAGADKLDVKVFDEKATGSTTGFWVYPNTTGDGGLIDGYRLARQQTGTAGMFLTGLFPYASSGSAATWSTLGGASVTNGKKVVVQPAYSSGSGTYKVTAWFREKISTSTVTEGSNSVTGDAGILVNDGGKRQSATPSIS